MEFVKKISRPIIGFVVSIVALLVEGSIFHIGKSINSFFPCVQETPITSSAYYPCYAVYDYIIMTIASIIAAAFLIVILMRVMQFILAEIRKQR